MNILISGSSSYIAKSFWKAISAKHDVIGLSSKNTGTNIFSYDDIDSLSFKPHVVYIFNGVHDPNLDKKQLENINYNIPKKVIDFSLKNKVAKVFQIGSYWQYNSAGIIKPRNQYAQYKEEICQYMESIKEKETKLNSIILNDVYGPFDKRNKILNQILTKNEAREIFLNSDGNQELNFSYLEDVISGLNLLLVNEIATAERFFISGERMSLKKALNLASKIFESNLKINWGDKKFLVADACEPAKKIEGHKILFSLQKGLERIKYLHDKNNH